MWLHIGRCLLTPTEKLPKRDVTPTGFEPALGQPHCCGFDTIFSLRLRSPPIIKFNAQRTIFHETCYFRYPYIMEGQPHESSVREAGIEPAASEWKSEMLPLHHSRLGTGQDSWVTPMSRSALSGTSLWFLIQCAAIK